jgi:hypothetical protein
MWICFNDGFVSVVKDKLNIDELVIRSRRKEILEKLFPDNKITTLTVSDYKYRTYCSKENWSKILVDRVSDIGYTNFKDSTINNDLHELYADMWTLHYQYQK